MAENERERIFSVFYRGTEGQKIQGTGVGLATVSKIARLFGGRAWVDETPGGGATFRVKITDSPPETEHLLSGISGEHEPPRSVRVREEK